MATLDEADRALAHYQNGLFRDIPDLTKISVVESEPSSGDFLLEAGVEDLRSAAFLPTDLPIIDSRGQSTGRRIQVRVVETGELYPYCPAFSSRVRPATGGDSVGRAGGPDTGTLGSLIRLNGATANREYFLSCWHVLVGSSGRLGSRVVQPGPADTGASPADDIGSLYWYLLDSEFDVAIGETGAGSTDLSSGCRCTNCSNPTPVQPTVNSIVAKCGRTSGLTLGLVRSVNASVKLPGYPTGKHTFTHQIETTAMAWPADSGSILFNYQDKSPVGLLLGGGNMGTYHNSLLRLFGQSFSSRTETYSDGSTDSLPAVDFASL